MNKEILKQITQDLSLIKEDNIVKIFNNTENSSVFVDFCSKKSLKRINESGILKQDIVKAIGLNKKKDLSILDCTAGLGGDSFIFASITEKKVKMLERNPTSFTILKDGLKRLKSQTKNKHLFKIAEKLSLENIDSIEFLKTTNETFDVIYIDPMFAQEKVKAKPKKEMAFFHQTVGNDTDSDTLLPLALEKAKSRVVVKRHKQSTFLNNQKPDFQFIGKSNRFDIYNAN